MLSKEEALRAYAAMINTVDINKLEPFLADDFHYASQWFYEEFQTKQAYLDYMTPKLVNIKASGFKVWAEMGHTTYGNIGPCVVIAQLFKDDLVAVVLVEVEGEKIKRLDMCFIPDPQTANRFGEYPK